MMQQLKEQAGFEMPGNRVDGMAHGNCRRTAPYLHGNRVAERFVGKTFYLFGHGGRKEEGLPLTRDSFKYFSDIRQKAHVEHVVCLIENKNFQTGQVDGRLPYMVEKTTGTGNNNLCALSQFLNLRVNVYSAVNGNAPKAGLASEGLNGLMYLLRQFARRGYDERPHIAAPALHQTVQYRQGKCGGLACASLSKAHDVPPLHYSRYRPRLYGSRRNISCRGYSFIHGGIEVKLFKIHNLLLSCSKKKPRIYSGAYVLIFVFFLEQQINMFGL